MLSPTSTAALWRSLLAAGAVFRGNVHDCQEQLLQQSLCPYSLCRKAFGTWFQTVFSSCWRAPVSHKKTWLAVVNFSTVTHWNGWAIYYCCAGAKPAWERTMEGFLRYICRGCISGEMAERTVRDTRTRIAEGHLSEEGASRGWWSPLWK